MGFTMPADDYGLYLHIPFCVRRCADCDFFSTAGKRRTLAPYVRALTRELEMAGAAPPAVWAGAAGSPARLSRT